MTTFAQWSMGIRNNWVMGEMLLEYEEKTQDTAVQIQLMWYSTTFSLFWSQQHQGKPNTSNSKIPISRVDPQSIYCRLSVFWCDSECVGSALMLGFGCVAPCQDITGSLKQGSVSLGHRLMTDLLPSTLPVVLFIKGKIILSQNRQVLFLSRWKLRKIIQVCVCLWPKQLF